MEKPYKLSFTAGGLLYQQTIEIAISCRGQKEPDWDAIRTQVVSGMLLHATRASSRTRYYLEIRRRFQSAHEFEIEWIASEQESARLALFALCCRHYDFLGEFMEETIRHKLAIGDTILTVADFYSFFEKKAETHGELRTITESSRRKVQTVLFRMLAEAGIADIQTHRFSVPVVPQALVEHYRKAGDYPALMHLLQVEGAQP
jgi:hypothetical protein